MTEATALTALATGFVLVFLGSKTATCRTAHGAQWTSATGALLECVPSLDGTLLVLVILARNRPKTSKRNIDAAKRTSKQGQTVTTCI